MPSRIADAEKRLRGTFQPCRSEKNASPVNPPRSRRTDSNYGPRAPQELDRAAKSLWRKLCAESQFSASELPVLAIYCSAYATFLACAVIIRRDGLITADGKRHPASIIQHAERQTLLAAASKLGLLTGGEDDAEDETAAELKRILGK